MLYERFSTSGQAGAHADSLGDAANVRVEFRPRWRGDPQPFTIETVTEDARQANCSPPNEPA